MSAKISILKNKVLSENWFVLRNYTYDLTGKNGNVIRHQREVYNRGNGATILLYNRRKNSVVLIRQFRMAVWENNPRDGILIETCAGLLDNDTPEVCIRKEAMEETGYMLGEVEKLFELYMSPGGVTELVHYFAAEYDDSQRVERGGGVEDEDIEVLELPFPEAWQMVKNGRIKDGKTVTLLQHALVAGWLHLA